jgi:hypothetical protein
MTLTDRHRAQPQITVTLRRRGVGRLRQTYFSQAWETAARYRIPFDRVIRHIWRARRASRRLNLRHIRHWEDLIHVIACIEGINLAWVDLAEQYERALIRQCRGSHDEVAAVMLVRRLFVDLRRTMHDDPAGTAPGFAGFSGQQPLGAWLCERLNAFRTRGGYLRVFSLAAAGGVAGYAVKRLLDGHVLAAFVAQALTVLVVFVLLGLLTKTIARADLAYARDWLKLKVVR